MKSAGQGSKVQVTLGELYRRMSADFRAVRPADHSACVMPMVVAPEGEEEERGSWTVEPLTSFCPFCSSITEMIVAEYATRFEVRHFPRTVRAPQPLLSQHYYCAAD
jgi:hypothetical protein